MLQNMDCKKTCQKLVLDNTYPSIVFDSEGICKQFYDFHNYVKPNWHFDSPNILKSKLDKIRIDGMNSEYDCILGLSGGIDSSYMLHLAVKEFGLRPLVFHVDGGWNTDTAVNNINNLVDKLNVDLYTEVINWDDMREFQLAMFKSGVPHLDIPQDMAFISVLYKFAEKHNIKWILNGGNILTESVEIPLDILYWTTDIKHIKDILKKNTQYKFSSYPFISIFYHKLWLRYIKNIKVFKPLNYVKLSKDMMLRTLIENYNFQPYPQKHFESRFTRFFEGYWLLKRFNFDMRKVQFSSLILSGQMTREEALTKLKSPPLSDEFIEKEKKYVASKLNISISELDTYMNMPKKYYWDYKNSKVLFEIGEKILYKIAKTKRGGAF
jgi:N-acetyl sugar amidotransferase